MCYVIVSCCMFDVFCYLGDATLRKQSTVDRRKKSKIGEIGDSLHTLVGTLSKRKGDKIKRALTDLSNGDCENAVLAGMRWLIICLLKLRSFNFLSSSSPPTTHDFEQHVCKFHKTSVTFSDVSVTLLEICSVILTSWFNLPIIKVWSAYKHGAWRILIHMIITAWIHTSCWFGSTSFQRWILKL